MHIMIKYNIITYIPLSITGKVNFSNSTNRKVQALGSVPDQESVFNSWGPSMTYSYLVGLGLSSYYSFKQIVQFRVFMVCMDLHGACLVFLIALTVKHFQAQVYPCT